MGVEVILGLGSNLGDRFNYLQQTISKLAEHNIIKNITCSAVYQTKALLLPNSPDDWNLDFLNMAIRGITELKPIELMEAIKNIERQVGRSNHQKWSPREIDIDILAYSSELIQENGLIIPHSQLLSRPWALIPFAEVYPDYKYPVEGSYYLQTIEEIISKIDIDLQLMQKTNLILECDAHEAS